MSDLIAKEEKSFEGINTASDNGILSHNFSELEKTSEEPKWLQVLKQKAKDGQLMLDE